MESYRHSSHQLSIVVNLILYSLEKLEFAAIPNAIKNQPTVVIAARHSIDTTHQASHRSESILALLCSVSTHHRFRNIHGSSGLFDSLNFPKLIFLTVTCRVSGGFKTA
jgi:hypothetical protein